jgi:hypothetical protein
MSEEQVLVLHVLQYIKEIDEIAQKYCTRERCSE